MVFYKCFKVTTLQVYNHIPPACTRYKKQTSKSGWTSELKSDFIFPKSARVPAKNYYFSLIILNYHCQAERFKVFYIKLRRLQSDFWPAWIGHRIFYCSNCQGLSGTALLAWLIFLHSDKRQKIVIHTDCWASFLSSTHAIFSQILLPDLDLENLDTIQFQSKFMQCIYLPALCSVTRHQHDVPT
jgi:hypothetical protein